MSIVKLTGGGAYEHSLVNNHAAEYLKRELNTHKNHITLDHPDGSVTKEKLSSDLRDVLTLASSGITNHEVRVKKLENDSHTHINKAVLDSITAEKTAKWDGYEASINKEKDTVNKRFALLNDNLETKADKADVYTKEKVDEQFAGIGQVVSNATYEAATALDKVESKAEQSYVDSAINDLNEKANMAIKDINLNINQIDSLWRDKADISYVDGVVGDIETALDNIITLQNSYVGGDDV